MSNRRRSVLGFTLVEMIVAIVIIGVGLNGILAAFNTIAKPSADPLIRKQMLVVAEELLEEIQLKPYATGVGTITGCNRSQADDIADYGGYANQPICDIDGTAVPGLSAYRVSVVVTELSFGTPAVPARRIEVKVTHGNEALTLVGWRANYAS